MAVGLQPPEKLLPVAGVRLSAACAGLYQAQRNDTVLIEIDPGSYCTAVFTRNAFAAAPVVIAREHLQQGQPRYCLINAGNANAGTGPDGIADALACCDRLAGLASCQRWQVLPFSTGVIGEPLPRDRICHVLQALVDDLDPAGWRQSAEAIMTTDTIPKAVSRTVIMDGVDVTITGMAKGSGMIRPDMATMLAFIATDASIDNNVLKQMLAEAMDDSFNRICVDGDTSTNDACFLAATGRSGLPLIDSRDSGHYPVMARAISDLCRQLAIAIVRDGEGATKFITVTVQQGQGRQECLAVGYAIATSPLVKTALFASDPNWGRILAAVGRAGLEDLDIDGVAIYLNEVRIVCDGGKDPGYTEQDGLTAVQQEEITVRIVLQRGNCSETVWTTDLSHEYIRINAEYRT